MICLGQPGPIIQPEILCQSLKHSLAYLCAYVQVELIGFVNLAWDGAIHAFLLDTTVHPGWQHQGIGQQLVKEAANVARARGIHWLHVDYDAHLEGFYRGCGFRFTHAGLMRLHE
jgi:ribosomal protein S18 acetylase RimI-like enzyme